MLGSSQNSAAFCKKKPIDPHLLEKSMKDLTVGVVFVCGGEGWDGWNYEARKGILIHSYCFNKKRESILTNGEKIVGSSVTDRVFQRLCFAWCIY